MVKRRPARLGQVARREAVLEASLQVFARTGLHGTTTRELARAAGVTEPVLYQHFAGKTELFLAVVALVGERVATGLEVALEGAEGAAERLLALATALQQLLEAQLAELRLLCTAAASWSSRAEQSAVKAAVERIGALMVAGLEGRGLRRGVTAATAGWFLLQFGLGAALVRPLGVEALAATELLALVQAALLA